MTLKEKLDYAVSLIEEGEVHGLRAGVQVQHEGLNLSVSKSECGGGYYISGYYKGGDDVRPDR